MENGMTLTHAEWEVAQECAKGLQDKEVADRLHKSIWTTIVCGVLKHIKTKDIWQQRHYHN